MKKIRQILYLFFWLVVCQLPGLAGAGCVKNHLDWYHALSRPPFTPPDAVFGLAWGILYILLGICAWLVFKPGGQKRTKALLLFIIQLALNSSWTPLFFGKQMLWPALVLLVLLLAEAGWLFKVIRAKHCLSAWLLTPYIAWLLFACYLNIGFAVLN